MRLIAPKFIKAYLKSQKNDFNDAEAIAEAAARPTMRLVTVKSNEQLDLQALHRIRERLVRQDLCETPDVPIPSMFTMSARQSGCVLMGNKRYQAEKRDLTRAGFYDCLGLHEHELK